MAGARLIAVLTVCFFRCWIKIVNLFILNLTMNVFFVSPVRSYFPSFHTFESFIFS